MFRDVKLQKKENEIIPVKSGSEGQLFGTHVRNLRKMANLTLSGLSSASGMSISALSKIENGQISPTFVNMMRLAEGLKMHIADLVTFDLQPQIPSARFSITRRSEQSFTETDHYGFAALCGSLQSKRMKPIVTRVRPENLNNPIEKFAHDGEEFLYVLKGVILIRTEYYKPILLEEGDSMYFDSTMPHCYVSGTEQEAEAFVMWLPESSQSDDDVDDVVRLRRSFLN
jgi:transcriptional regulator with XRE-family HTH domain